MHPETMIQLIRQIEPNRVFYSTFANVDFKIKTVF